MASNRLGLEQSPYLLQHADNPVNWYAWGDDAFAAAAKSNKPILLSIGYSTCHWCHVMAHESFEDDDIASVINEHYIAIKVDREERPDIDHVYMTAVTAMTGQGGWPLTVFLTPNGKPFYGGTYFPPFAKWGAPGFCDILLSVSEAWKKDSVSAESSASAVVVMLNAHEKKHQHQPLPQLSLDIMDAAFQQMSSHFDERNGGFGSSPKFPMPHGLYFLLRYYRRTKEPRALLMVERSLMAMADGGIRDHLGGGFHRYSTDAQWHVPHFEKMLYDQALLARAYLEAFQVTGHKEYADIAEETFNYVLRDMRHSNGGFYCAEDADSLIPTKDPSAEASAKAEGAFYVWAQQEIIDVIGLFQARAFSTWYGVGENGNAASDPHGEFIGKNILFLAKHPEDQKAAAQYRQQLFERRKTRPRPHLDDKVMVDWNGLMISALAFGGRVLGKEEYTKAARRAADFILSDMMDNGRLLHRWRGGQAGIAATIEDYAFFVLGLVDLYEACFEEKYLEEAKRLALAMIDLFEDRENGSFYMTARDVKDLIVRPREIYDGAIPSGNSAAAWALLRLHNLGGDEVFYKSASRIFAFFADAINQSPYAYAMALCAYDLYQDGGMQVTLSGPSRDSIAKMEKVLYKHFIPNKSVVYELGGSAATARVCKRQACQVTTDDPAVFESQITG